MTHMHQLYLFLSRHLENVGVSLFQESLLSEYEDYGHFWLESFYFSLHVHDFISSLIRPMYGVVRVAGINGINVQVELWRKEILRRVSLFVAYSWQRLYVSYKMGWLSWHSWIILSWAEEYAISSSMAGTSISATDPPVWSLLLTLRNTTLSAVVIKTRQQQIDALRFHF